MEKQDFKQICVKILIYKGYLADRVVYYRNRLPLFVVEKWKWYFEYLAARIKVNNPRIKVELIICQQDLLQGDEYKQKKIQDLLKANKSKLQKMLLQPIEADLFGSNEETHRAKIEALQAKVDKLEEGEFDGYIPEVYINDVKNYIRI